MRCPRHGAVFSFMDQWHEWMRTTPDKLNQMYAVLIRKLKQSDIKYFLLYAAIHGSLPFIIHYAQTHNHKHADTQKSTIDPLMLLFKNCIVFLFLKQICLCLLQMFLVLGIFCASQRRNDKTKPCSTIFNFSVKDVVVTHYLNY